MAELELVSVSGHPSAAPTPVPGHAFGVLDDLQGLPDQPTLPKGEIR